MPQQRMITVDLGNGQKVRYPADIVNDPEALAKAQAEVMELKRQAGTMPGPRTGPLGMNVPQTGVPPELRPEADSKLLATGLDMGELASGLLTGVGRGGRAGAIARLAGIVGPMLFGAAADKTRGEDPTLRLALNAAGGSAGVLMEQGVRPLMQKLALHAGGVDDPTGKIGQAFLDEAARTRSVPGRTIAVGSRTRAERRLPKVDRAVTQMEQTSPKKVSLARLEAGLQPDTVVSQRAGSSAPVTLGTKLEKADRDFLLEQIAKRDAQSREQEQQLLEFLQNPTTVQTSTPRSAGFKPSAPTPKPTVKPRQPFSDQEVLKMAQNTPLSMTDLSELRKVQGREASNVYNAVKRGEMVSPMDQAITEQLPARRRSLARQLQVEAMGPRFDEALRRSGDLRTMAETHVGNAYPLRGTLAGLGAAGFLGSQMSENRTDDSLAGLLTLAGLLSYPQNISRAGNVAGQVGRLSPTAIRSIFSALRLLDEDKEK